MYNSLKAVIYLILDVLTLRQGFTRKISGFSIKFPPKWARYFQSDYELENVEFLNQNLRPGMVGLDVGAHLGLFSVMMGQRVGPQGKIFSFEPTPNTFKVLTRVVSLNSLAPWVSCFNLAVSNDDGQIDFFVDQNEGSNANSLVSRPDKARKTVKINTTTLDTFVSTHGIAHVDLIKIDVEGAEHSALLGALNTLKTMRPKLILAIHPMLINNSNVVQSIFDLLQELNYRVVLHGELINQTAFCSQTDFFDVHLLPN